MIHPNLQFSSIQIHDIGFMSPFFYAIFEKKKKKENEK